MSLKQDKYLFVTLILFIFIPFKSLSSEQKSMAVFNKFNDLMDKIEYNLNTGNIEDACKNSTIALTTIEDNKEELTIIQPNYSWLDIKNLLEIIPIQLCNK